MISTYSPGPTGQGCGPTGQGVLVAVDYNWSTQPLRTQLQPKKRSSHFIQQSSELPVIPMLWLAALNRSSQVKGDRSGHTICSQCPVAQHEHTSLTSSALTKILQWPPQATSCLNCCRIARTNPAKSLRFARSTCSSCCLPSTSGSQRVTADHPDMAHTPDAGMGTQLFNMKRRAVLEHFGLQQQHCEVANCKCAYDADASAGPVSGLQHTLVVVIVPHNLYCKPKWPAGVFGVDVCKLQVEFACSRLAQTMGVCAEY